MTCWDCLTGLGEQRTASSICANCGAAVCAAHAVQRAVHLTATVGANRKVPVDTPARLIQCRICHAAARDHELTTHGEVPRRRGR